MKRLIAIIVFLLLILAISIQSGVEGPPQYSIVFFTGSKTHIETLTVDSKGYIFEPKKPTQEGADFVNWYTTIDYQEGTEFDFSKPITKSVTLYGKWNMDLYYIDYYLDGGYWPSAEIEAEYKTVLTVSDGAFSFPSVESSSKAPIHENGADQHRFIGWFTISQSDYNELSAEARKEYRALGRINLRNELDSENSIFDENNRVKLYAHYRNLYIDPTN